MHGLIFCCDSTLQSHPYVVTCATSSALSKVINVSLTLKQGLNVNFDCLSTCARGAIYVFIGFVWRYNLSEGHLRETIRAGFCNLD